MQKIDNIILRHTIWIKSNLIFVYLLCYCMCYLFIITDF